MRVTILGSGSRGNATLLEANGTALLVEAGLSPAVLRARLEAALGRVPRIDGVVVTHAHGDHAGHAAAVSRAFEAPLYVTQATQRALRLEQAHSVRVFGRSAPFDVRGLEVRPFPVPHDAPQVALVVAGGGERVAIATDLGETPRGLAEHFEGASAVLLEANHDPELLRIGPYPRSIQDRVAARTGHLSNGQTAAFLRLLRRRPSTVVLLHLSESNNRPALAWSAAHEALRGHDVELLLAPPDRPLQVVARHRGQLALPL